MKKRRGFWKKRGRGTILSGMTFDVLTAFPGMIESYAGESLFARAQKKSIVSVRAHDLRTYSTLKHKKIDDRPFGGGPGMVLMVEPIYRAVRSVKGGARSRKQRTRVILFSTRGKTFDAAAARRLARYDRLILVCGRYEGVDERVAAHVADEEMSIGGYVLSGGELPALVVMEAVARHIPGFLGKQESLEERKGSYPAYTRPEAFEAGRGAAWKVPKVLLSGDHKKIEAWRRRT